MMCNDIPFVLRKHVYAVAAIVGSIVFYTLSCLGLDVSIASLVGMISTVALRLLARHYEWNLPRVREPDSEESVR